MYKKETVLSVKQLFDSISNTTSSNEKLKLLKDFSAEQGQSNDAINFLKSILHFAYNPQIRFFLKPIALSDEEKKDKNRLVVDDKKLNELLEYANVHIMHSTYPSIFDVLERFASRTVTGDEAKVEYLAYILRNQKHDSNSDDESSVAQFLIKLFNDIIDKDLKIGISTSTINKVFPKLIPEMGYMRCSLIKAITAKEVGKWLNNQIISQEKMDGMFINLNVNDEGNIEFISRSGSVFPVQGENSLISNLFQPVLEEIQNKLTIGYQYHGEMLMLDSDGNILPRQISNGLFNAILKNSHNSRILDENQLKDYSILISLWDRIPLELIQLSSLQSNTDLAKSHHNLPYIERLNQLKDELSVKQSTNNKQAQLQLVETRYYNSILEADEHFKQMLKEGKEGTIVKLPTMLWKDGTSKEQIKLKNEFCIELKIKDFVLGSGKNVDLFGSITCVSNNNENEEHLVVNVPSSGFTDSMKKEISANKDEYIGKIITVKANNIMPPTDGKKNYSLFLPVFIEFREDKDEADSLLKIKEQYESSINGALQEQIKQLINKSKK